MPLDSISERFLIPTAMRDEDGSTGFSEYIE